MRLISVDAPTIRYTPTVSRRKYDDTISVTNPNNAIF